MSVFDTVPRGFFLPLASPGAEVYLHALFAIWDAQRFNPLLERHVLLDYINDALQAPEALRLTEDAQKDIDEEASPSYMGDRAGIILRYFLKRGWLREEDPTDFDRVYTLPHYAQKLLDTLSIIGAREKLPIRGLICSIRDILQAAVKEEVIEMRIPEAYRQTVQLRNGLGELQDRMREHIQQVAQQRHTSKVLAHLSAYYAQVSDLTYKQLRTTDHVSRFRPQILEAVRVLDDIKRLTPAMKAMLAQGDAQTESEALSVLEGNIAFIRDQFEILHTYLDTLEALDSRYTNTVTQAIQRDIYARSTISGRLRMLLQKQLHSEVIGADDDIPDEISQLIDLFQVVSIDTRSLSTPKASPQPFITEAIPPTERIEPQEQDIAAHPELLDQMRIAHHASRPQIQQFVLRLLQEQSELHAEDIPITDIATDMPRLMLIWAYGDGSLGYYVQELPSARWIEFPASGLGLRDFLICKGQMQTRRGGR